VEFFRGDGCWSYIGRQGGRQQISLGIGCDFGAAVHEIGHAAGLWHEQTRHDRDQFVVVRLENVQPGMEHNFTLYPDGRDEGPYDYGSIMHYPPYGFSRNGLPTLEPRQPGVVIGQRNGLSAGDRSGIAALYGFTPPPAERTELQNGVPVYDLAGAVFEELRFFLVVPDGVRSLEFATSAGTGDADLYVRRENDPSFDSYDCRPFLSGGAESCRFDAPAAGTYHVMLRAYTAFSGVSLTGSYEMPGGAGLVSGKLLKLKQFAHAPQKDKIVFKSSDSSIAAPPAASSADPMQGGGRLVLANPATGEVAYLELPAGSWSRNAKGHLVSSGLCSVKVKAAGKLSVACEGTNLGFTLDEAYQGSLAVKLELGSGVSYCAVFGGEIVKDSGIGWDSEGSAGRFQAKDAPRPASCPY
jgi:hypothetical protein